MSRRTVNLTGFQPVSSGSVRTDHLPAIGSHVLRVRRAVTTKTDTGERSFHDEVYCSDPHRDQRTGRSPDGPDVHDEHLLTLRLAQDQPWATGWSAPGWDEHASLVPVTVSEALAFVIWHVLGDTPIVEEHLANAAFLFTLNKDLHAAVHAYAEWVGGSPTDATVGS
jgi:hypothetical protein